METKNEDFWNMYVLYLEVYIVTEIFFLPKKQLQV